MSWRETPKFSGFPRGTQKEGESNLSHQNIPDLKGTSGAGRGSRLRLRMIPEG